VKSPASGKHRASGCAPLKIKRVYAEHGRYYYLQDLEQTKPTGKPWQKKHPLTRVSEGEAALLNALAEFLGTMNAQGEKVGNIGGAIDGYLKVHLPELKNGNSKKDQERMFGVIKQAFAEFDVDQIAPGDVLTFLNGWADKPTARRAYKARLSGFFGWCVISRLCRENPCRELKLKQPPKRKATIKSPAIYHAIRDALPPIGQCFLDLCFLTTARPTEIRVLRESQIYDGVLHFLPSKTEQSSAATVDWPITPEIEAVLKRARSLNKLQAVGRGDASVIQTRDGSRYSATGLFSMWKRARTEAEQKVAGCAKVTTRDIRPYALTSAEKAGARIEDLRKAAAHTTTATTEGYLDQYRQVVSPIRMTLPQRPNK
jgi:integrase